METNNSINKALLENDKAFIHPFFDKFRTSQKPKLTKLTDLVSKNYLFPTFYSEVECGMAIFKCNWNEAKNLLPDNNMYPVSIFGKRALVLFSCYRYRNVSGISSYNEIGITIPVYYGRKVRMPILPLVNTGVKGFGYFIVSMPVTSLENKLRGDVIWNMTKITERIDLESKKNNFAVNVFESNQIEKPYLSLNIPKQGEPTVFNEKAWIFTKKNGVVVRSLNCFGGTFNVKKHTGSILKSRKNFNSILKIEGQPRSMFLKQLEIQPDPIQTRYSNNMNSVMHLPERI